MKKNKDFKEGLIGVSLVITFILLLVYLEWTVAIPIIIGLVWSYALLPLFYKMFVQKNHFLKYWLLVLVMIREKGKKYIKYATIDRCR